MRPLALCLVAIILALFLAREASAHTVGLSKGDYVADGASVRAEIAFARGDAVDAGAVVRGIDVIADGESCAPHVDDAAPAESDGFVVHATYACARPPDRLVVRATILASLPAGHRHLARLVAHGVTVDDLLTRDHAEIGLGDAPSPSFVRFVALGVEHILTGYDHLLFLLGLVLVPARFRSIALLVTAFTVAHSITLALAALGIYAPPPRVVEPLIALSVAYVGVENFFVTRADRRWRITFPFGLVHGFGFAGALRELALSRGDVARALVGFNIGVEIGQLGALALLLPMLFALRKLPRFERYGARALSGAIVAVGLYWFAVRVAHPG